MKCSDIQRLSTQREDAVPVSRLLAASTAALWKTQEDKSMHLWLPQPPLLDGNAPLPDPDSRHRPLWPRSPLWTLAGGARHSSSATESARPSRLSLCVCVLLLPILPVPVPSAVAYVSAENTGRSCFLSCSCKAAQASNRLSLRMPKSGLSAIEEWICHLSNGRRFSRWVPAITEEPSIDWLSCAALATSRPTSFANAPLAPVTAFQNGARAP